MGLGRFGGGFGVTKWLLEQGADVLLTDLASEEEFDAQITNLQTHQNATNLQIRFGEHRIEDFVETDCVVANPAVPKPWENHYLQTAWNTHVHVTTEIEILTSRIDRHQVIGVTGTSGKSTTVSMIHNAIRASGRNSHLGGNIGGSLLSSLQSIKPDDIIVLELSSAMLWWLDRNGGWSPHIGGLTTVEENHIDWHGTYEEYTRCKQLIFTHQSENDIALTQDPNATFSGLTVIGKHNERNAALAFLAVNAMGVDSTLAREGIQSFAGLPHRLQKVGKGFYNDSKSTTPVSTALAIDSFPDSTKVHVIVGGFDKKVDLSLLAKQSERVGGMYTIGSTGDEIATLSKRPVQVCDTLECAVNQAKQKMSSDDVLLLSPGCASWDQFENYEERGKRFCELIGSDALLQQDR